MSTIERIAGTHKCGFCLTSNHSQCCVETSPWYGRVWTCGCGCEKGTKKPKKSSVVAEHVSKVDTKKATRVRKVAQKELDKVLASDEVRKVMEDL
jgi:hypothetical protein